MLLWCGALPNCERTEMCRVWSKTHKLRSSVHDLLGSMLGEEPRANTNGWDVLCVYVICCFTAAVTAAIQYAKQMITKCSLKA